MPEPAPRPEGLAARLRQRLPTSAVGRAQLGAAIVGGLLLVALLAHVLSPLAQHPRGYGRQAWDAALSGRYFVVRSLARFHQLPLWNPYGCGGFPALAASGGDANLVSPALLAYLLLPLPVAARIEIVLWLAVAAAGAWALAARFTRSPAMAILVAALFVANSRVTLQLAGGHLEHLGYALLPWALFFLDRAAAPGARRRLREEAAAGACLALMLYGGATDALPEALVVVAAYAVWVAVATRAAGPLRALGKSCAIGAGLAAPKLLPLLDAARSYPRPTPLPEAVSFEQLAAILLSPQQGFRVAQAGIPWQAWHEHGMYVGAGALVLLAGALFARGPREQALRAIALSFGALSLGAFTPYAPAALAHDVPLLGSATVATRWLYPAALLLACSAASLAERWLARTGRGRAWLEVALVPVAAWIAWDVGHVARMPLETTLHEQGPRVPERLDGFVTETRLPASLEYQAGEWAPTSLSAELANVGTIECNLFDGLATFDGLRARLPGYGGRPARLGARGRADKGYRGEVYLLEGRGTAAFTAWSPRVVEVHVDGAQPGDHLVLNQNWDPGWTADGAAVTEQEGTVAAVLGQGEGTVRFRYRPRTGWPGVLVFAATVGALATAGRRRRRA